MARLDILHYPDARLHTVAKPVPRSTRASANWSTTWPRPCTPRPGIGLAATQVDVHERVIVIDISETHDALRVLINPEIVAQSGTRGKRGRLPVGARHLRPG